MAAEDGDDLAGDLAGGEVALDAEFGGETELTVDGAADLRGDADGGAAACGRCVVGFAVFGAVAVGHPDGLDGLVATGADEVALGAVDGAEGLENGREADGVAFCGELLAQGDGERGNRIEVIDPVPVEGLSELAGTEVCLIKIGHERAKLLKRKAEEWLHRGWCRGLNRFRAGGV